jgi:hypothetical protein
MSNCRCGYKEGDAFHPCHGEAYKCRKPSQQYFYDPYLSPLSGAQMKFTMSDTWACPECWEDFKKRLAAAKAVYQACSGAKKETP